MAAIERFCCGVLAAVCEHVPCVKPQLACFERYRAAGFDAYARVVAQAKSLGLMVIADAKRADIGISSEHYAAGLLSGPDAADALTVNTYLGADALGPFLDVAAREGKGLFALVRTTNPGGDAIQDLALTDGRRVGEAVGDMVAALGASKPEYVGGSGYSLLGAVVGATKPHDALALRARLPQQLFLVPGFGAQGGGAEAVKACFKTDRTGAVISASRSVIYAGAGPDWQSKVERAAIDLKGRIVAMLD